MKPPGAREPPPVSVVLLVVSGVTFAAGGRVLAPAFDKDINPLCQLDITSRCNALRLKPVTPSTSVPNWIAALTGASPTTHGVLSNMAIGPFPFDSVFGQAQATGTHAGISAAPWFVGFVKPQLPPLDGDGRVSSSADGVYETTRRADTSILDSRRRAATLDAVHQNRHSVSDGDRSTRHPTRYPLFVSHLTNADSVAHRRGTLGAEYEEALRDAQQFILELMEAMPPHSVLLVATDHGHEPSGGAGGVTDAVTDLGLYVYRKSVLFSASPLEIDELARVIAKATGREVVDSTETAAATMDANPAPLDNGALVRTSSSAAAPPPPAGAVRTSVEKVFGSTAGSVVAMEDLAPTIAMLAGLPTPRHAEGAFVPLLFENVQRTMWPAHCRDLLYQRHHYASALMLLEDLDGAARLRPLADIERDVQVVACFIN